MTDHVPSPTTREPSDSKDLQVATMPHTEAGERLIAAWLEDAVSDESLLASVLAIEAEAAAAPQARVRALEADLAAIYGRMRHTHPDDVSCAKAGPKGHPPYPMQPEIGWSHSGPCARPDCDCTTNRTVRALAAEQPTAERDGGLDVAAHAQHAPTGNFFGNCPDCIARRPDARLAASEPRLDVAAAIASPEPAAEMSPGDAAMVEAFNATRWRADHQRDDAPDWTPLNLIIGQEFERRGLWVCLIEEVTALRALRPDSPRPASEPRLDVERLTNALHAVNHNGMHPANIGRPCHADCAGTAEYVAVEYARLAASEPPQPVALDVEIDR